MRRDPGQPGIDATAVRPPFDPLVRSLLTTPPPRDETLQHPRTVFRIVKRHFSRYKTPTDGRGIGRDADIGGTVPTRGR